MISTTERSALWAGPTVPLVGKGRASFRERLLEDRLWAKTGMKMNAASFSDKRVLLVGFAQQQRAALREMLEEVGVRLVATTGTVHNLGSISGMQSAFGIVIVDFDSFADTEQGVDELMAFRATSGHIPLMLCSARVKGDDLTSERSAVCDATLRSPTTCDRLRAGLSATIENSAMRQKEHSH